MRERGGRESEREKVSVCCYFSYIIIDIFVEESSTKKGKYYVYAEREKGKYYVWCV